jgi:type I restriction enzyme M protein
MFEQTIKNIDDILRKEAGCATELDYAEQISWILFLKYLDDLEVDRQNRALLTGEDYDPLLS